MHYETETFFRKGPSKKAFLENDLPNILKDYFNGYWGPAKGHAEDVLYEQSGNAFFKISKRSDIHHDVDVYATTRPILRMTGASLYFNGQEADEGSVVIRKLVGTSNLRVIYLGGGYLGIWKGRVFIHYNGATDLLGSDASIMNTHSNDGYNRGPNLGTLPSPPDSNTLAVADYYTHGGPDTDKIAMPSGAHITSPLNVTQPQLRFVSLNQTVYGFVGNRMFIV